MDAESETLITHALTGEGFDASEDGTGRGTPLVAVPILEAGARTGKSTDDIRAGCGIGEPGDPMYTLQSGKQHAVGFQSKASASQSMNPSDVSPTLDIGKSGGMAVRRLTPRECERLQGFPDDFTVITVNSKPAADGPRYRALGNSMAVPVLAWLGERIKKTV